MKYLLCLFAFTLPVFANAGVPMLVIMWPPLVFSLLFIILIESYIVKKMTTLSFKKSLLENTLSNLFSTLLGVPLIWTLYLLFSFLFHFVIGGYLAKLFSAETLKTFIAVEIFFTALTAAPWIPPYSAKIMTWAIPLSACFLIIAFFYVSWKTEEWLIHKRNPKLELKNSIFYANLASYGFYSVVYFSALFLLEKYGDVIRQTPLAKKFSQLVFGFFYKIIMFLAKVF